MVAVIPDQARRGEIIKSAYDLNREPCTASMINVAVKATAHLSIPQLEAITQHVASTEQKPGTPTLRAMLASADSASRDARRKADLSVEQWCIPSVNIDWNRKESQAAILMAWKRPASRAIWDKDELAALRAELEGNSPALAAYNGTVRSDMAYYEKHRRMPRPEEREAR